MQGYYGPWPRRALLIGARFGRPVSRTRSCNILEEWRPATGRPGMLVEELASPPRLVRRNVEARRAESNGKLMKTGRRAGEPLDSNALAGMLCERIRHCHP